MPVYIYVYIFARRKKKNLMLTMQAPSFVFVDEIDAIAGRHARKDPRSRATFEALISQLDGEYVLFFLFWSSELVWRFSYLSWKDLA